VLFVQQLFKNALTASVPSGSTPNSTLPLATTTYTFGNNSTTSLNLRVQRNF
jgi:hypothetical protein